jgi:hypothetical protein
VVKERSPLRLVETNSGNGDYDVSTAPFDSEDPDEILL